MTIRIIDNKQVDITDAEWTMYQNICKSYDSATRQGKFLFTDLFDVDDRGIIQILKPPKTMASMEVWMFIMALQQQQHLREVWRVMSTWKKELEDQFSEKMKKIKQKD